MLTLCLCLCQSWADAFRSSPDLTGVVHIYEELKRKGIEFPMADLDALSPIHTPQRVRKKHTAQTHLYIHKAISYGVFFFFLQGTPEVDPAMIKYLTPVSPAAVTPSPIPSPAPPTHTSHVPGPITATPDQVRRFKK